MTYVRNSAKVKQHLRIENDQLLCDQSVYIHVPTRFMEKGLGEISANNTSFGIFPIILANSRTMIVPSVDAIVHLNPFRTDEIDVEGDSYYSFYFEADTPIISNMSVVRSDSIMYNILDELLIKGKVPWYLSYEDLCKFLDTAETHAGSNVAANYEVIEILSSMIARNVDGKRPYVRSTVETKEDLR